MKQREIKKNEKPDRSNETKGDKKKRKKLIESMKQRGNKEDTFNEGKAKGKNMIKLKGRGEENNYVGAFSLLLLFQITWWPMGA